MTAVRNYLKTDRLQIQLLITTVTERKEGEDASNIGLDVSCTTLSLTKLPHFLRYK